MMPKKRARRGDTFPKELGANIRLWREERRLTQRELSAAARYDLAQLSSVEGGKAVPRADALRRIADVLDVSLDRLCGRPSFTAGEAETGSRSADRLLSVGNIAIAEELRDLRRRLERMEAWRVSRTARPRSST
ncbi:MAG TPA: helix-turn-helix transcriptional regulator [Candidatus Dormibacteraeota bacterium]|nr:helix-turn-helix transcriptional regulator [Candidatus Dormibacteraeota bacterium]